MEGERARQAAEVAAKMERAAAVAAQQAREDVKISAERVATTSRVAKAKVAEAKAREVEVTILEKELVDAKAANVGVEEFDAKVQAARAAAAKAMAEAKEAEAAEKKALTAMKNHMGAAMANAHTSSAQTVGLVSLGLDKDCPNCAGKASGNATSGEAQLAAKPVAKAKACHAVPPADSTDPSSRCKIGKSNAIFSVGGKNCANDMDYTQAEAVCAAKGAHVCSHDELTDAFRCSYNTCVCGWTSTSVNKGKNLAEMVVSEADNACSRNGTNVKPGITLCGDAAVTEANFGVHCCGSTLAFAR